MRCNMQSSQATRPHRQQYAAVNRQTSHKHCGYRKQQGPLCLCVHCHVRIDQPSSYAASSVRARVECAVCCDRIHLCEAGLSRTQCPFSTPFSFCHLAAYFEYRRKVRLDLLMSYTTMNPLPSFTLLPSPISQFIVSQDPQQQWIADLHFEQITFFSSRSSLPYFLNVPRVLATLLHPL